MADEVQFFGTIDRWTLGEPPRLEIVSRPNDNAVAQSLALLKQRILSVTVYEGAKDDEFCRLTATLPPIASSVGKAGKCTRVKLDVDSRETKTVLRLLAISDKALRFAFTNEGEQAGKQKREAKMQPERGPHGKFWELLHSFHNRPDVRGWLGFDVGYADEKAALAALYRIFNVTSRTFISPDDLREWAARMPEPDGVLTVIELAKAKTGG